MRKTLSVTLALAVMSVPAADACTHIVYKGAGVSLSVARDFGTFARVI